MRYNFLPLKELDNIAIIGVGLLGGSIGLGLRASGYRGRIIGVGHRTSSISKAVATGCIDQGFTNIGNIANKKTAKDIAEQLSQAKLVIFATPIGKFAQLMTAVRPYLSSGTVVTDVGSSKRQVLTLAKKHLPKSVHFVGSHPMAGSEKRGVDFARADLFDNAVCIITPQRNTAAKALTMVRKLWQMLGMTVVSFSAHQHDRILARISHLPHVAAAALVNCCTKEELKLCGAGFLDTTRIASSDVGLWNDIIESNSDNIVKALKLMQRELSRLSSAIENNDTARISKFLEEARKHRQWLINHKLREKQLD